MPRKYTHTPNSPHAKPTPPAAERALTFVASCANHCRGCFRRGTTDCATRCPLNGVISIANDLATENRRTRKDAK